MRIQDAAAFVENVKGDKVHWPDQFTEIAADECNGAEQDFAPGHRRPPDGWREAAQCKEPEADISGWNQAQRQIPAPFVLELRFDLVWTVEVLVNDSERGQNQRLLLGKECEAVGEKHRHVRKQR